MWRHIQFLGIFFEVEQRTHTRSVGILYDFSAALRENVKSMLLNLLILFTRIKPNHAKFGCRLATKSDMHRNVPSSTQTPNPELSNG